MSDHSTPADIQPQPFPPGATSKLKSRPNLFRDAGLLFTAIVLIAGAVGAYLYWGVYLAVGKVNYPANLRAGVANTEKLDEQFTAAGDTLVAAPPADAKKLLDPDPIQFGVLEPLEKGKKVWKEFADHLSKSTGKKVEIVEAPVSGAEAVTQLKEGKLHLAALSTGAVPLAVTKGGYVPFASMGDDKGNFSFQMEILVRADSPVQSLADLKGKKLAFGSVSSLSSFKAPIVLLWTEAKFLPGRDYDYFTAGSQRDTIRKMLDGEEEVVAVANDLLGRLEAEAKAKAEKDGGEYKKSYRSIYKSKDYPSLCFGHNHALKPELVEKIQKAFFDSKFAFAGTGMESYTATGKTKFVPVTYKKDWENVRAVDKALLDLVSQNP